MNERTQRAALLGPVLGCLAVGFAVGALTRAAPEADSQVSETRAHAPEHDHGGASTEASGEGEAHADIWRIEVSNAVCPVMGGDTRQEVAVEWSGLRVLFCCPGCEEDFLADPEGMLDEVGFDHAGALDGLARLAEAEPGERAELAAGLSERYGLIPPPGWEAEDPR